MRNIWITVAAALLLAACDRPADPVASLEEAAPEVVSSPAPTEEQENPPPTESTVTAEPQEEEAFEHDPSSRVTILGYHRFESPARDSLAITPEDFREQIVDLRERGVEIISMEDFLAWRRGEKNIPPRSALITIDDGYNCTYRVAWPILEELDAPFAVYPYINYISVGGRSITWEQLEELRDAGVHIGSHSVSHGNLVRRGNRSETEYRQWLEEELKGSKETLEERLGIEVTTFVYPYGLANDLVREIGREAGYEALFTVRGEKVGFDDPYDALGRYVIESNNPAVFQMAANFGRGGGDGRPAPAGGIQPADGEVISTRQPLIEADLSSFGPLQPESVEMSISGVGVVPAQYNPETGVISYQVRQRLRESPCTVRVTGRDAQGRRLETEWSFVIDPTGS